MKNINKIEICGLVGKDPRTANLMSGSITSISVATRDILPDGSFSEQTDWHRIVFTGAIAKVVQERVKAKSEVRIVGRLKIRKWIDKRQSQPIERQIAEIHADEFELLSEPKTRSGEKMGNSQNDAWLASYEISYENEKREREESEKILKEYREKANRLNRKHVNTSH